MITAESQVVGGVPAPALHTLDERLEQAGEQLFYLRGALSETANRLFGPMLCGTPRLGWSRMTPYRKEGGYEEWGLPNRLSPEADAEWRGRIAKRMARRSENNQR